MPAGDPSQKMWQPKISPDITKCPLGGKSPLFENHWHKATKSFLWKQIFHKISLSELFNYFFLQRAKETCLYVSPLWSVVTFLVLFFFYCLKITFRYNTLSSFDFLSSLGQTGAVKQSPEPCGLGTLGKLTIKHSNMTREKRIFFMSFLLKMLCCKWCYFQFPGQLSRFPSPWR